MKITPTGEALWVGERVCTLLGIIVTILSFSGPTEKRMARVHESTYDGRESGGYIPIPDYDVSVEYLRSLVDGKAPQFPIPEYLKKNLQQGMWVVLPDGKVGEIACTNLARQEAIVKVYPTIPNGLSEYRNCPLQELVRWVG